MQNTPSPSEINSLFFNVDPDVVWGKATDIIRRISPSYDFSLGKIVFDDIVRLFHGEYPDYGPIRTPYHNLNHTLDILMCAVRLMHGAHLSGIKLTDDEITLVMIAAMMHDIGYVQRSGEEAGTGAQFQKTHVARSIEFMQRYIARRRLTPDWAISLELIILCTNPAVVISEIDFPDVRLRLLGQIIETADLTGQMADRAYLEKLLFLYLEFKEAHFGNYQNVHDLLRETQDFYLNTREKLDGELGGVYTKLSLHFKEVFGEEKNYYLESIEKNIAYLAKIVSLNDADHLAMLKREGIVEKAKKLMAQKKSVATEIDADDPE